jgi:polyisoprenoid-binding protein YceI
MRARLIGALVVAGALASCSAPAPVSVPVGGDNERPAGFPEAYYLDAARRGAAVYAIDPGTSLVVIEVRRAGTLAQLGHDHVVASHETRGYVAPADGRADLYVRLDRLAVDEADLRAEAKLESQPPDDAIAGTRDNMLRKLGAQEHPYAIIGVRGVDNAGTSSWLDATLTVNGTERAVRIPARIAATPSEVDVTGQLEVQQTSFGITPYSILAGALQVKDEVAIRFRIRALRVAM